MRKGLNAFGVVLVLAGVAGCAAKAPARSFPELQKRVHRGTTVYVIDRTGSETRGKVVEVSPSALTYAVDGVPRRIEQDAVRQVQTYGDPLWNGLLIGLAVGVPGALIADPTYSPCQGNPQRQCANSQAWQRVLAIGITGGVGAGIDALIRGRHQIYLSPGQGSARTGRFTVSPRIDASGAAIFVTLRAPSR